MGTRAFIKAVLLFAVVAVVAGQSRAALAQGQNVIGINFVGTGTAMGATEAAGVVASTHWNNAVGARRSTPLLLVDGTGAATGVGVTWSADGTWRTPIVDTAGNNRLMRGYLDTSYQRATTITVTGLAAGSSYDVYVYADGDNGSATRTAAYQVSGTGIATTSVNLTDAANTNFSGTFVRAANSSGNYVRFTITATGFTLTATPGQASDGRRRAPVNGIEIVRASGVLTTTYSLSGLISPTSLGTGTTLTLSGGATGTTSTGAFSFTSLTNGTYTVTPSRPGYTFTPAARTVTINGANVTGVNFTASGIVGYSISGTITPAANGAGSTVTLTGAASATTTADASGHYTFTGLANGTYTVTPSRSGYTFTPASASGTLYNANVTGVDFTAIASTATYSLSGLISPASLGTGTTLTLSGGATGTTGTTSTGAFSFTSLTNGTYTVTPSRPGYTFTPAARTVTINGANVTGVNFTASGIVGYSISGTIAPAANGAGSTVTLTGAASATTTADASGHYTFTGLANGTYTVTPSRSGYTFTPKSASGTLYNANVTGVDFTATAAVSTVIFYDDFTGTSIDTAAWTVMNRPGDPTNDEAQCYRLANVAVADGNLNITARAEPVVCSDGTAYSYTSGMVQWTTLSFLYGTVEIRARLSDGQGPWAALWLLGTNCQQQNITFDPNGPCDWPNTGSDEIDIADNLYGSTTNVYQWIHSNTTNTGCITPTTDVSRNWHTYSLTWAPGLLEWRIDGGMTCRTTTGVPSTPMFLILNVAMNGAGGGPILNSTLPQAIAVDYVKVTAR